MRAVSAAVFLLASAMLAGCRAPSAAPTTVSGRPGDAWGCWTQLYGQPQYRGEFTTYTGPSQEAVVAPHARSLVLGPQARLEGYKSARYEQPSLVLPPGTHAPDLAAIGFHDKVDAFRLVCMSNGEGGVRP